MREHVLGQVASLLNQVMRVLPKEIWITKWAVPCFEGPVVTNQFISEELWSPMNYRAAAQRLRRSFVFMESAASQGAKWFYTGVGKDNYHPRFTPGPHEFWSPDNLSGMAHSYGWDFSHFLGMMTSSGIIKQHFFDAFLQFAEQHNAG